MVAASDPVLRFSISEPFSVSASCYARAVFRVFAADYWMWLVLPVAACAMLAVVDVRFILVAFMALFIAIPMVMALVYFNAMLTRETRYSLISKSLVADDAGLHILPVDEGEASILIPWQQVRCWFTQGDLLLFGLRVRRYQFLAVPLRCLHPQNRNEENT